MWGYSRPHVILAGAQLWWLVKGRTGLWVEGSQDPSSELAAACLCQGSLCHAASPTFVQDGHDYGIGLMAFLCSACLGMVHRGG